MSRNKNRRRLMSEINVVPYIDVMLVLLIIFMVTAPILTQGVNVELPQAEAESLSNEADEPLLVTVDKAGEMYIGIGEENEQPVDGDTLVERVQAALKQKPKTPVMVRGDKGVPYGRVVEVMVLLQAGGAPSVGLVTESPEI
jgi:biopolymer transport protein TolR